MVFSWDLIQRITKFSCYAIFRQVFLAGRNIIWVLNGTYWLAYRNRTKTNYYSKSAHIHNIFGRFKFDVLLGQASFLDFILTHDHFDSPEYVLRDNVSLYQVTGDKAIFVEVPEHIDAWRCENGSFLRQAQFNFGHKVITMPLQSFHALADKVADPKAKLVFVQNTARCGSTLLVRIFEDTGRCVAFSEPDSLNAVASYAGSQTWEKDQLQRITKDAVRLLCKPTSKVPNAAAFMMKMTVLSIDGVPMLQKVYPDAAHIFMYRDPLKVAQSLLRAQHVLPLLKMAYEINSISPALTATAVSYMGLSSKDTAQRAHNQMHIGVFLWSIVMNKYMELRDRNVEIAGVAYEDLHDDPDFAIKAILKYCGLPEEFCTKGKEALQKDAQGNSALASSVLTSMKVDTTLTPKTREYCNETLMKYGLPLIGELCIVPGTITHTRKIVWPPKY